jgi:hypothetical protein
MVPARFAYFLRIRIGSKLLFVADPSSCTGTDAWLALSHWRGFFWRFASRCRRLLPNRHSFHTPKPSSNDQPASESAPDAHHVIAGLE